MRNYQKKKIIKKGRNVTIRFDQETFDKIEATARAADLKAPSIMWCAFIPASCLK